MRPSYGALRLWSTVLIGGPLAALFASWPIALGQGLRAIADVAEYVQGQQTEVR
jgi:hypothetical protein